MGTEKIKVQKRKEREERELLKKEIAKDSEIRRLKSAKIADEETKLKQAKANLILQQQAINQMKAMSDVIVMNCRSPTKAFRIKMPKLSTLANFMSEIETQTFIPINQQRSLRFFFCLFLFSNIFFLLVPSLHGGSSS